MVFFSGSIYCNLMMIVFIADDDFYPSSDADHTPVSYLRTILPKWKKQMKTSVLKPGSPLLLVLTSSAIRAVQLNRYVLQHSTLGLVHVSVHTAEKREISVGKILMAPFEGGLGHITLHIGKYVGP